MGATSVTGVSGHGAAEGNKGPGNGRNQFVPLRSPHIVAAGSVQLGTGAATVTLPTPLPGAPEEYVVMLTSTTSNGAYVGTLGEDETNETFTTFAVHGTGTDTINWVVCTVGNA